MYSKDIIFRKEVRSRSSVLTRDSLLFKSRFFSWTFCPPDICEVLESITETDTENSVNEVVVIIRYGGLTNSFF